MRLLLTRATLALALTILFSTNFSWAAETKLTTDEIQAAFSGNTVHGLWGDTEYYSFFDTDGRTSYTTKGGIDWGHWRAAHDQYCSIWQTPTESCYDILRDGNKIIWVLPSSGKRYESTLIPGRMTTPTFQ